MTPSFTVSVYSPRRRVLTGLFGDISVGGLEEADLCREGDGAQARRTPWTAIPVLIRAAPPAYYSALGPGRTLARVRGAQRPA